MAEKYFDFDKFMEEKRGGEKPFVIKAFGEEHEIPGELPFDIVLQITRAQNEGQEEIDNDTLLSMCNAIFGEATFKKWVGKGIGIDGIMILTEKVLEMYMAGAANTSNRMAEEKKGSMQNP